MNKQNRPMLPLLCLCLTGIVMLSGCGSKSSKFQLSSKSPQSNQAENQSEVVNTDSTKKEKKDKFEISKYRIYDENGTCTVEVLFEYNEEGKLTHQVQNDYEYGNIMESEMFYTYPEKNRQIRTYIDKETGKRTQSDEAVYNDAGDILTESSFSYDENGSQENNYSQKDYFYDDSGNLIKKEIYDTSKIGANVTSKQITQYSYDNKGNLITEQKKSVRDGQDDSIWFDYKYEYDGNGNKIRAVSSISDSTTDSPITYSYNDKNLLIKESDYMSETPDVLRNYYIYEYDGNDNLIKCTRYSADDKMMSYNEYEYIEIGAVPTSSGSAVSDVSLYQKWHIDGTVMSTITFKTQDDTTEARCEINDFDIYNQIEVDGSTSTGAEITDTTIKINYRPDEYITFTYSFQNDGTLKFINQETGKSFIMHLI